MFSHSDPWQCFYQEVANLLYKVLTRQIIYPKCSRMHHFASFCVPPTAFSLSRVGMYGTSLVQTDLNKLKVKCCRLEIAVYMRVSYQLLKCNYLSAHSLFVYNFNVPLIVDSSIIISFAKEFIQ